MRSYSDSPVPGDQGRSPGAKQDSEDQDRKRNAHERTTERSDECVARRKTYDQAHRSENDQRDSDYSLTPAHD
jgi:hypothetical protein